MKMQNATGKLRGVFGGTQRADSESRSGSFTVTVKMIHGNLRESGD